MNCLDNRVKHLRIFLQRYFLLAEEIKELEQVFFAIDDINEEFLFCYLTELVFSQVLIIYLSQV